MHVTVVRQEIVDKYPWVATNLVKAFDEAKALAYRRIANPRVVPLAWIRTAWEEQQEVLGDDPWAYGLTDANRTNLETVQRYCHQQGLISREAPLEELFKTSDFISLHSSLTPETKHLINAKTLALTKKGVRIANCARGELVDEAALLGALEAVKLLARRA